jgi:hypothetical protein
LNSTRDYDFLKRTTEESHIQRAKSHTVFEALHAWVFVVCVGRRSILFSFRNMGGIVNQEASPHYRFPGAIYAPGGVGAGVAGEQKAAHIAAFFFI